MHGGFGQPWCYAYSDDITYGYCSAITDALSATHAHPDSDSNGLPDAYRDRDAIPDAHPRTRDVLPAFHPD